MDDPASPMVPIDDVHIVDENVYPGRGSSEAIHRVRVRGQVLLYKAYKTHMVVPAKPLRELVEWRAGLDEESRDHLDARSAFPVNVVVGSSSVTGICMYEAPSCFTWTPPQRPGQPSSPAQRKPRGRSLDMLGNTTEKCASVGWKYFEVPHKLAVLGELLEFVLWLHDRGVVVGDLNPQNVLINSGVARPSFMLLDCDSAWRNGVSALPFLEPEGSVCPFEPDGTSTPRSDLYKFALYAGQCLMEDLSGRRPTEEYLSSFMPSDQARSLLALLEPGSASSNPRLRGTATSWSRRMSPSGDLYQVTDGVMRAPWESRRVAPPQPSPKDVDLGVQHTISPIKRLKSGRVAIVALVLLMIALTAVAIALAKRA